MDKSTKPGVFTVSRDGHGGFNLFPRIRLGIDQRERLGIPLGNAIGVGFLVLLSTDPAKHPASDNQVLTMRVYPRIVQNDGRFEVVLENAPVRTDDTTITGVLEDIDAVSPLDGEIAFWATGNQSYLISVCVGSSVVLSNKGGNQMVLSRNSDGDLTLMSANEFNLAKDARSMAEETN